MKSIEELIDDIIELAEEGVLYTPDYFKDKYKMDEQLNQSKDNKAEILRRFEELEKAEERQRFKKEYYHEEHAKELIKRVELEKEVKSLRCCGNCGLSRYDNDYGLSCSYNFKKVKPNDRYCDNWLSDGIKRSER